ncbi:MAG: prephenate dehydrogenase, partial [Candidatus Hydrogenedentes bacterium]|nr:prephenate dehydrogenase [Candidatus Hydrogenedentota bacterium]
MTIGIEQVTIIGVGLLGASFGLALKKRGLVKHIVGVGRTQKSLDIALQQNAIDEATLDLQAGVSRADIILIATPVQQVIPVLDASRAAAPSQAIFLDVASTKQAICDHARTHCPVPRRFVGCHPMAGSEKVGPSHGTPDFYAGSVCLVEQDSSLDMQVRETVCELWRAIGMRVVDIDISIHDAMLARTSHAPHILAAAIAQLAADFGVTRDFVGKGFLDVTRIAAACPEIWRDICMANRDALRESLEQMRCQ